MFRNLSISFLLLWTCVVNAQTIHISIPDTTAKKGDTLFIPIRVSPLAAQDSVYSAQISLSYNSAIVNIIGIEKTGTVLQNVGSVIFNPTVGILAFASSDTTIKGSGVLVYLKTLVQLNPTASSTTINFTSAIFNEGKPDTTITTNGSLRILAISISPKSPPSTVIVGDSLQFSATGDKKLPLTWVSSDTTLGKVDANGRLITRGVGQMKVYLQDAQGLQDSTNLFAIYPAVARSLTVTIRDTSYTQTLQFNLPIYVSDVTSLGILSAQLTLTYNGNILQAMDIVRANSMTSSWTASPPNITSGRVDLALAGTDTLTGRGVLFYVRFRVLPNASTSTTISFSSILFNENLNANAVGGHFNPLTAPAVVISPNTAVTTKADTLRFKVTSGGTPPYVWSSNNLAVATINSGSGLLTGVARGTATVTVVDGFGFTATTGAITVNDFRATLPDTTMGLGDSVDVPIIVDDVTGLGLLSFETRITYDSTIVRAAGVLNSGTLSSTFTVTYKDSLDTLRIAAAGTAGLSGSGSLLKIRFRAVTSQLNTNTPLNFVYLRFNESGLTTPTATTRNGKISIMIPLAVELAYFTAASSSQGGVVLEWMTVSEVNNYGFEVERRRASETQFQTLPNSFTPGHGTTSEPQRYSFTDRNVPRGQWAYRLKRTDSDGSVHYGAIVMVDVGTPVPAEFVLQQNYPNPFNPTTEIRYQVVEASHVRLDVYDMLGQLVATLVDETQNPGYKYAVFDSHNLPSGIYVYRLTAGKFTAAHKMVLLR